MKSFTSAIGEAKLASPSASAGREEAVSTLARTVSIHIIGPMKLHLVLGWLVAISLLAPFSHAAESATPDPASTNWTTSHDHKNMMDQLGIAKLRPGPAGRRGATNEANYDESKANPFPNLPDPRT